MDRLVWRVARLADRSAPIDARWLTRHFEPVRLRVCDLGCGSGWLMNRLTQLGHACTGLEVDPEAAEAARSQGLRVLRGSIDAIPEALAKRRFDVVFMLHVLEHCRDPRSALAAASKLLAPGGTLVVEVPNNEALGLEHSGIAWPFLDVPRHLWFFTPSSLRDAVERAGLEVQTTEYFGYMRQFTAEWIDEEQRIWDSLRTRARSDASMPPRASRARAYALLARTLVEPPARRHDSVRVLCRR